MKTPIRNMLEDALIDIVENGGLDTLLIRDVDKLTNSARFLHTRTRRVLKNKFSVTSITALVNKQVFKIGQNVRFERALEYLLTKRGMTQ